MLGFDVCFDGIVVVADDFAYITVSYILLEFIIRDVLVAVPLSLVRYNPSNIIAIIIYSQFRLNLGIFTLLGFLLVLLSIRFD